MYLQILTISKQKITFVIDTTKMKSGYCIK